MQFKESAQITRLYRSKDQAFEQADVNAGDGINPAEAIEEALTAAYRHFVVDPGPDAAAPAEAYLVWWEDGSGCSYFLGTEADIISRLNSLP